MRTFILSLVFIFSNSTVFTQENLGWNELEIFMMTNGLINQTIRYKMEAFGTVWNTNDWINYFTTTNYNQAYFPPLQDPETGNTDWSSQIQTQITTFGFNFIPSGGFWGYGNYAYGLYRIDANITDQYFYLDYRDDRYPLQIPPYVNAPGGNDIWILYDKTNNIFKYSREALFTPISSNWIPISKGAYLSIWQIKGVGTPTTNRFPNFWQNCLSVVNDGNNHPRLVWGPIPNHTYYTVHRKYGASPWAPLFTTDQTTYVDNAVNLVQPGSLAGTDIKYKVAPVTIPTYFTNEVTVNVVGREIEKKVVGTDVVSGYLLHQNYPNPFNPSTVIRYVLPENGNIKLVVTNSLGEEVKILDEGFKEAGEYSKTFNSENLPSGIYFCSFIT